MIIAQQALKISTMIKKILNYHFTFNFSCECIHIFQSVYQTFAWLLRFLPWLSTNGRLVTLRRLTARLPIFSICTTNCVTSLHYLFFQYQSMYRSVFVFFVIGKFLYFSYIKFVLLLLLF